MLWLGIETSTEVCSVALFEGKRVLVHTDSQLPKAHLRLLPLLIDPLFWAMRREKSELKAVALASGPGSYTGLRVASSLAKGMALGLSVPLWRVPTLQAMTAQVRPFFSQETLFCPVLPSRRQEVYVALYDEAAQVLRNPSSEKISAALFASLSQAYPKRPFVVFGPKALDLQPYLPKVAISVSVSPSAKSFAQVLEV